MALKFGPEQLVGIACIWEATARKVGNVHPNADFADTTYLDFLLSATAIVDGLTDVLRYSLGTAIWRAACQTNLTVGKNTNLGIVLLLAPMVQVSYYHPFRAGLKDDLARTTKDDTCRLYEAIRLANPGGLGDAPNQDVRNEPTVTLLEAMKLAADRDMIARQYANGYADVFDFGVPSFLRAFEKFGSIEAAIIDCQLCWMAEFPDSLIARKNGPAVAEEVRRRAAEVQALGGIATPEGRAAAVELDRYLRSDGNKLNPGTTADLIAACLFVALRENKVSPSVPFRWQVEDWL